MRKLLSLLVLIALLTYSCKTPKAFEYRDIKNIRVENLGSQNPRVSMDLVFFNPNKYGVNLKNVKSDIFVDSNYIGNFLLDTTMHIPKGAEFTIPASMQVDLKGIMFNSLKLLLNNSVLIGAKGSSKVGKGGFYVTIPFSYEGRQKINLF